jgi:hypothetical protein
MSVGLEKPKYDIYQFICALLSAFSRSRAKVPSNQRVSFKFTSRKMALQQTDLRSDRYVAQKRQA